MSSESLFAGLMTGTSLDGVDAVLASVTHAGTRVLAHHNSDLPTALRADLQRLCSPGDDEIDLAGACHRALGAHYADAVATLLDKANVPAGAVTAIGSSAFFDAARIAETRRLPRSSAFKFLSS